MWALMQVQVSPACYQRKGRRVMGRGPVEAELVDVVSGGMWRPSGLL